MYDRALHVDYKLERREEMQSTSHTATSVALSLSLFLPGIKKSLVAVREYLRNRVQCLLLEACYNLNKLKVNIWEWVENARTAGRTK